jgi:hypothetical protein
MRPQDEHVEQVFEIVLQEVLLQRSEHLQRLSIQSNRAISLFTFSGVLFFTAVNELIHNAVFLACAIPALVACLFLLVSFRGLKGIENGHDELERDLIQTGQNQLKRVYRSRVSDIISSDRATFAARSVQLNISLVLVALSSVLLLLAKATGV